MKKQWAPIATAALVLAVALGVALYINDVAHVDRFGGPTRSPVGAPCADFGFEPCSSACWS